MQQVKSVGEYMEKNRLGGSSLLDCVVFGRVSGRNVTKYLLQNASNNISKGGSNDKIFLTIGNTKINVDSNNKKITINWNENKESKKGSFKEIKNVENEVKEEKKEEKKLSGVKMFTAEEVAKHNTEK